MPGINDSLNWNLTRRESLAARVFADGGFYIPAFTVPADSYLMMFGFKNPDAKSNWWLAADLYQQLLTLPSSTSEFQASVEAFRTRCRLNTLSLVKFPNYGLLPFLVEIRFPPWHKKMDIEIWHYSGEEIDQSLNALNQIDIKVDEILAQFEMEP